MLLPFIRQEGGILSQQDNTCPHTAAATQHALRDVQLPWQARTPDLSPIEDTWDMIKLELTLSPELATTIAGLQQQCKMLGTVRHRMIISTFMTVCMREYTPVLPQEGATLYLCDCFGTPYCDVCFIWFEFVIIYSYNDKLSHQFAIQ